MLKVRLSSKPISAAPALDPYFSEKPWGISGDKKGKPSTSGNPEPPYEAGYILLFLVSVYKVPF